MITPLMSFPILFLHVFGLGMISRFSGLLLYRVDVQPAIWALTCTCIPKLVFLACRYRREWANRQQYLLQLETESLNTELQLMLDGLIPPDFSRRAQQEEVVADPHDRATVLFCSFPLDHSAGTDSAAAFRLLDEVYRAFDAILEARAHAGLVTKVEHVGHDYLAVSPVFLSAAGPAPDPGDGGGGGGGGGVGMGEDWAADSCAALAEVARELLAAGRTRLAGSGMELRVGLATGPVVAAVIGRSRRYLRVLGDTVNTAARMCSLAGPWQVREVVMERASQKGRVGGWVGRTDGRTDGRTKGGREGGREGGRNGGRKGG
jgi:adenylate cyclase